MQKGVTSSLFTATSTITPQKPSLIILIKPSRPIQYNAQYEPIHIEPFQHLRHFKIATTIYQTTRHKHKGPNLIKDPPFRSSILFTILKLQPD